MTRRRVRQRRAQEVCTQEVRAEEGHGVYRLTRARRRACRIRQARAALVRRGALLLSVSGACLMRAALAAAAAHEVMHKMTGEVQALRDARTQLVDYHAAQRNLREARKGVQAAQAGKKEAAQALADARQNLAASAAADRAQGRAAGYVSMTVPRRELDVLPQEPLTGENSRSVAQLAAVRNFVILLNPGRFESRAAYLAALRASPADLLIIDLYYGAAPLTRREVARLQEKPQGGRRLVLAYLSVGEAADYRPYWQKHWAAKRPDWLAQPNPAWPDSYRVKYWSRPWRRILYGSADAYLDEIIDAGFDGAFLDVMDAWQTFQ